AWLRAVAGRVEDGQEPSFHLRRTRHGERCAGQTTVTPRGSRDLEEVARVVRRARAGLEDLVVAGAFPLDAHLLAREPDERMEPVERRGEPRHALDEPVAAPHLSPP